MKKTSFIVFALALLFICRPLMAQTSFKDLPVEFRKNGYPQLVKECKEVLNAAYDVGDNENNRKHKWLEVVRQLYQQAWHSDRNELMIAWAKSSPQVLDSQCIINFYIISIMFNNYYTN